MIKLVGRRCPNISLELLSARLAIKRALSEDGGMRRSKKWSKIRNSAEGLLASILGYNTAALAVLSCSSRWFVPLPVECRQEGEGGAFVLAISDVQAVKSTRSDVFSLSLHALPALPAVASMADPPCHNTAEGSERMQPESEADGVGRNTAVDLRPQSQAEFFRTMTTPDAIAWAKSYNLGWRRATAALHGNHKKKKKTAQDAEASASAQSQSSRGMLLAVFQSIGRDNSSLHHPRDTLVYAVAEKFSVSAMFTRIDIMQYQGGHCLRWNYQEHNCIESTLLMTTFYAHCSEPGNSINVGCVVLSPDKAERLLTETVQAGDAVCLKSVLEDMKPCFVMTQAELPRPASATISHRRGQTRAKASAGRGKAKGKAKSKAKSSVSSKRQHQELEDGSERGSQSDAAPDAVDRLDRYLQDDRNLWEEEYQSDSETSLFAEDTAADLPAAEIKTATVARGPSKSEDLPSSDMVRETAERLHEQAQLTSSLGEACKVATTQVLGSRLFPWEAGSFA